MSTYTPHELSVGAFVALGVAALAVLSVNIVGLSPWQAPETTLTARFSSIGSLKPGDPVKIAGVTVGSVDAVQLIDFEAEATFALDEQIKVPKDSIASIQSAGLLGDSYVSLSPGASDEDLEDGGRITRTEPAVSLTEMIAKYAFGSPTESEPAAEENTEQGDTENSGSPFDDPLAEPEPREPTSANPSAATGQSATTSGSGSGGSPRGSAEPTQVEASGAPEAKKKSPFVDPLE